MVTASSSSTRQGSVILAACEPFRWARPLLLALLLCFAPAYSPALADCPVGQDEMFLVVRVDHYRTTVLGRSGTDVPLRMFDNSWNSSFATGNSANGRRSSASGSGGPGSINATITSEAVFTVGPEGLVDDGAGVVVGIDVYIRKPAGTPFSIRGQTSGTLYAAFPMGQGRTDAFGSGRYASVENGGPPRSVPADGQAVNIGGTLSSSILPGGDGTFHYATTINLDTWSASWRVFCLFCGGTAVYQAQTNVSYQLAVRVGDPTAPCLEVSPTSLSFGELPWQSVGRQSVIVRNAGAPSSSLQVVPQPPVGPFSCSLTPFVLAGGESRAIEVSFSPRNPEFGPVQSSMYVTSNAPDPTVEVRLSGIIKPAEPVNWRIDRVSRGARDPVFSLFVWYTFDSSSGVLSDLNGVQIREVLERRGGGTLPNPVFVPDPFPFTESNYFPAASCGGRIRNCWPGERGVVDDAHGTRGFTAPVPGTPFPVLNAPRLDITQRYEWRAPWTNNNWRPLAGPYTISRYVEWSQLSPTTWKYTHIVEKHGKKLYRDMGVGGPPQ